MPCADLRSADRESSPPLGHQLKGVDMGVAIAVLGGLVQIAIPIAVIVFFVRRRRGGNAGVDLGLVVRRLFE